MTTSAEFLEFLNDPSKRAEQRLLLIAQNDTKTVNVSDFGYTSDDNVPFPTWFYELPDMEYDIESSVAIGSFKLRKPAYIDDEWGSYEWTDYPCDIYCGSVLWDFADYVKIASTVFDKEPVNEGAGLYAFYLADHGKKLEISVQPDITDEGEHKLLCYGDVFNRKPQLVDALTLKYRFHDGVFNGTITVWDIGLDITTNCTINYTTGEFTINAGNYTPAGSLRINTLSNVKTVPQIAQAIADKHSLGTITFEGFEAWQLAATMRLDIDSDITVDEVFTQLARSINGNHLYDKLGNIIFKRLDSSSPIIELSGNQILDGFAHSDTLGKAQKIIVNYGQNASPQNPGELSTLLSDPQKDVLGTEFLSVELATGATSGIDAITYDTLIAYKADADLFAIERKAFRSVNHKIYKMPVSDVANVLHHAMPVTITHPEISGGTANGNITRLIEEHNNTNHECEVML